MKLINKHNIPHRTQDYCDPFWNAMVLPSEFPDYVWERVSNRTESRIAKVVHSIVKNEIKFELYQHESHQQT